MIKRVFQISDVHIRNLQRHNEYEEQICKTIEKIKELSDGYDKDEMRIVICGDITHQKTTVSNELFVIMGNFIRRLEEICKVLVISGNHDMLVNNNNRTDTISALFETAQFDNSIFIDQFLDYKSGVVIDDNITWVLYSIHDNYNKPYIKDVIRDNPDNVTVGLYHGIVKGATLNSGIILDAGTDDDFFEGCDIVMAGHIHKRQHLKRGDTDIVYSGSLIQQTMGEKVTQHGFVLWNIQDKSFEFVDIDTDYGIYKIEINDVDDITNDKEIIMNY